MKKIILLVLAVCTLLINPSYAGFLVKKNTTKATVTETKAAQKQAAVAKMQLAVAAASATHASGQKQSFVKKVLNKVMHPEAEVDQVLYIICCVFWLGWLAMGINDDFGDNDWLICLLLYILFYFPGLIYSLIKMDKYY